MRKDTRSEIQEDSQASFLVILTPSHTILMKDNSLRVLAWVVEGME